MKAAKLSQRKIVHALRTIIDRRGAKITELAETVGVPYRSLQNYLYGKTGMPLDIYVRLCAALGITPDYPVSGRFRLDHSALQRAIRDVFGDTISRIHVSEDSQLSVGGPSRGGQQEAMRVAGFLAALIAGRYDVLRESEIRDTSSSDQ